MLDFSVDKLNYDTIVSQQQLIEQAYQEQAMLQQQMAPNNQPVQTTAPAGGQ